MLEFVRRKYSVELSCMIGDFLEEDESKRADFVVLAERLLGNNSPQKQI